MTVKAIRYHDISVGHRVVGHEGKCRHLHGHNYRVHFTVEAAAGLDDLGRVLDFTVIKTRLCEWLEHNWDHKFLAWEEDTLVKALMFLAANSTSEEMPTSDYEFFSQSIVWFPTNPTAENMAEYLVEVIGPKQLEGTGCTLTSVVIEETRKCSCSYEKEAS